MGNRRRFLLVRHGVTDWNREMRMQGHTDVPLNSDGRAQAARIGARLSAGALSPDAVWSSDLSRAYETARSIATPLGLSVRTTPLLRETMLGDWEGLTRDEIVVRGDGEQLENYLRDSLRFRPPGSETLQAVWERMLLAQEEIRADHPTGTVAIVGHGGSLRALLCAALDAPIDSMRRLWLDNTSLSVIEELGHGEEAAHRITLINDTSHLIEPCK
jgi:broad specificity phosphatase PhoE